jgi:hypothetical protein
MIKDKSKPRRNIGSRGESEGILIYWLVTDKVVINLEIEDYEVGMTPLWHPKIETSIVYTTPKIDIDIT